MNPLDFTGRVALVTGGGRGMGRAVALALAQCGAAVAVVSRTPAELDEVTGRIAARGGTALGVPLDMAAATAPAAALAATVTRFGRLDMLINCAGQVVRAPAAETLPADWDALLALNVKTMAETCRLALPHLRRRPGANIVNMSSITGLVGTRGRAAYAATKMAILGYTRVLAHELADDGIRVNAVAPGFIDTAFVTPYLADAPGRRAAVLAHIPLGRIGTADEVAWPIVFLASPAASYITGQTLVVDGGWLLA